MLSHTCTPVENALARMRPALRSRTGKNLLAALISVSSYLEKRLGVHGRYNRILEKHFQTLQQRYRLDRLHLLRSYKLRQKQEKRKKYALKILIVGDRMFSMGMKLILVLLHQFVIRMHNLRCCIQYKI